MSSGHRKRDETNALVLDAVAGKRTSSNGWVRGNCPVCEARVGKADRKGCLGLHAPSGRWHCFRCGAAGRLDEGDEVPGCKRAVHVDAADDVAKAMEPPDGYYPLTHGPGLTSEALWPARRYLFSAPPVGRGLDPEVGHEARIGACAVGLFAGRVIVPVLDVTGEHWLGWSSRAWIKEKEWAARMAAIGADTRDDANPYKSYLYPRGMPRGRAFYRHDVLHVETDEPVLVVEGVFDALCDQVWPHGVAVLGKPSHEQLEALIVAKRPVVFVLDGDAWREAEALTLRLRFEGQRAGFVRLPPKKDPDELPAAWLHEAVGAALCAP